MPVDTVRGDYKEMLPKWKRLRDCFGGRDTVLAAGKLYVPDLDGTNKEGNDAYRARGSFFNALAQTVKGMNGSIFQNEPKVEMPKSLEGFLKDVTLTNVSFEMFASEVGKEVFLVGRYGVLVDFPVTGKRPYLVGYSAEQIINWRVARRDGDEVLTMLVLHENVEEANPNDMFAQDCVEQWRVLWLDQNVAKQQMWRENPDKKSADKFIKFGDEVILRRRGETMDLIPFVFMNPSDSAPDIEQPLLIDLADVNLGHWRNSVDYEHGMHLVAIPTPWVSGLKGSANPNEPLKMGPKVIWELEPQGSAGMVEFTGQGLKTISDAMSEKKKQMATLGARLLEDAATTSETATAVRMRHSGEHATLRSVASSFEQGLTLVMKLVVWWMDGQAGKPADIDVEVTLNKEYLNVRASSQDIQVALTALQAGEISYETWYEFLRTGGWSRPGVSAEDEMKAIRERKKTQPTPPLPEPPKPPENNDDENDDDNTEDEPPDNEE